MHEIWVYADEMAMSFELPTDVEELLLEQAAREGLPPQEVARLAVVDRALAGRRKLWVEAQVDAIADRDAELLKRLAE